MLPEDDGPPSDDKLESRTFRNSLEEIQLFAARELDAELEASPNPLRRPTFAEAVFRAIIFVRTGTGRIRLEISPAFERWFWNNFQEFRKFHDSINSSADKSAVTETSVPEVPDDPGSKEG